MCLVTFGGMVVQLDVGYGECLVTFGGMVVQLEVGYGV